MSTDHHTPIAVGAVANAATFNAPLGQLDAVLGPIHDTVANMQTGIYNVLEYGAIGDGSADDTAAVLATIAAATAGSTVVFPHGTYKLLDGLLIEKPLTIDGQGSTFVFTTGGAPTNLSPFWFRSSFDSNSASKAYNGPPDDLPTYYRTFSGAVVEGNRTFTLASVTGLSTGTEVQLRYGVDPNDATSPFLCQWNRVASVSGSDVTFAIACPEDINGTSHKCVTFNDIVENCGIKDCTISYDGTFAAEVGLWIDNCRNFYARNIIMSGLPRGIVVEASDNVEINNIYAKTITKYFFLNAYHFTNLHASNLSVDDCYNAGVYFESQGRGALVENVRIGRGATANSGSQSVLMLGGCRGIVLRNFHITHTTDHITLTIGESSEVKTEDWYLYNSEYHNEMPLVQHHGLLYHNEKLYQYIRHFSRRFPMSDTMDIDVGLPSGVYKDVRIFVTNTANLTTFALNSTVGDIKAYLTANTLVRPAVKALSYIGKDAAYPFNNTEAHSTTIQCSGMPAGAYGIIEIDYYEPNASADDTQKGMIQADGLALVKDGSVTAAKLLINQASTTGAVPVLQVTQADVSEEFIRFIGTSTTDASQSLVDAADMEVPGAIVGWLKIYVQDDQATNPITDGAYYIPFYSAPTHSA